VVFFLILLDGLAFWFLARALGWNTSVSAGLAMAWAFSPFVRARAKVHMSMTGIYHLPLIFLGLFLVARGRGWRSVVAAAACWLIAATTIHYFLATSVFLSPLFVVFVWLQPEARGRLKQVTARLALAALPAVLFLAFNFARPLPPDAAMNKAAAYPRTGETASGEWHPFLFWFAAAPLDYLGSDLALTQPPRDWNPLRRRVNEHILANLGHGNAHEHTNGIRWSVLLLTSVILIGAARRLLRRKSRSADPGATDVNLWFFLVFGAFCFSLSLPPDTFGFGPSAWLYALVHQVRVPARAGIGVHFAALMICGLGLARIARGQIKPSRWRRLLTAPAVLPILMLLDYPPLLQAMPMSPVRPAYAELQRDRGACGAGFYFPFADFERDQVLNYHFYQRLRGSDCQILNGMSTPSRLRQMEALFPVDTGYLSALDHNLVVTDQITRLVRCVPLSWIAFDPHTPRFWAMNLCRGLGWHLNDDLTCVAPDHSHPLERYPDECE
jgi:hypothetical protein